MKLVLLSLISSLFINSGSPINLFDREKVIDFNELPAPAQKFLNNHFAGEEILSIVLETEIGDKEYSVFYDNGTEVKFDRKGNWESVEHEYSKIPESVVPEAIMAMIKSKQPGKAVTGISRDLTGRDKGYEVELENVIEMKFDIEGRFIRYDD